MPSAVVDGRVRADRAPKRTTAVQLAVATDVQERRPVSWIRGRVRSLRTEDDAATGGLEPGLERAAFHLLSVWANVADEVLGQTDVARAIELEHPRGCRCGLSVVGEDPVGGDLVADGAIPLHGDARPQVEGDQVAVGRGGPTHEVVVGAAVDLDPDVVWLGLRAGRIGPEGVTGDPVAGGRRSP